MNIIVLYPSFEGGYSAIPCDTLKNIDAIGIAIPYSAIGGVAMLGRSRLALLNLDS